MRRKRENGQALMMVVLALGIFLIGALGLAIDGAQMFAHRQMAQAAADAAAQAGIMSIFNKTNTGSNFFGDAPFMCTTATDVRTPCIYARSNGFGSEASDAVNVSFPNAEPGVQLADPTVDPTRVIEVQVTRTLQTGLIRFLGPDTSTITALARAAIVDVVSPVPILVTHPKMPGALHINGGPDIKICGGPERSIQVNSLSTSSITINGTSNVVDLSRAGPADDGFCTSGTGADFGDFGGPSSYPNASGLLLGSTGDYLQPAAPILDPLRTVPPPTEPPLAPAKTPLADGVSGCPAVPQKPCQLYYPGTYPTGIKVQNETAVFSPGLYYIKSDGFVGHANGEMYMCTACSADAVTADGMVVYNTGGGPFIVGANGAAFLRGAPVNSIYKGILLFNDRNAPSTNHRLGGGGAMTLTGTIYITNTRDLMNGTPSQYQYVLLQGNPGTGTLVDGMIIVSTLELAGAAEIMMKLDPAYKLNIRQVALVR